jgi:DNA repair protein RadC
MAHHIFQFESELKNVPEAAPKASRSSSISEKLAQYGSSTLSGVEHLTLLVGKKSISLALIRHFGSLKGLARAPFQELWQFLPRPSGWVRCCCIEHVRYSRDRARHSEQLDNPELIYRACADIEALRPWRPCLGNCWNSR